MDENKTNDINPTSEAENDIENLTDPDVPELTETQDMLDGELGAGSEILEEFDDSEDTLPENIETTMAEVEDDGAKKKFKLQTPVIIAACILVAALLGYAIFNFFILKEPEGMTWSQVVEGATYYYEFNNDNTFKAYVGSVEIDSTYQKTKSEGVNTLTVGVNIGNFYAGSPATYEISGSRLFGNQTMQCSYGEGSEFSLYQANRKEYKLELPEDFTPDEDLLGTWIFQYFGYDIYKVTFNDDGTIKLQFIQDGITYNGTYTIEDGKINFTYYVASDKATQLEYSVDGDKLNFLGASFVREGSEAANTTADQVLDYPQE